MAADALGCGAVSQWEQTWTQQWAEGFGPSLLEEQGWLVTGSLLHCSNNAKTLAMEICCNGVF